MPLSSISLHPQPCIPCSVSNVDQQEHLPHPTATDSTVPILSSALIPPSPSHCPPILPPPHYFPLTPDADASSADTTKTDTPDVMANNNNSSAAATSSTGGGQVMPTGKTRVHEEDGKAKAKPVAAWQRTSPRCHCCF
eukprot:scaffold766_cov210-Alexandrium_tamarense.AAC.34